jgi:outer membrane lipopolysaccharide assembly protein LptE/RlpB
MKYLKINITILFIIMLLANGCGYKLGGLEVVGENSDKVTSIKIQASSSLTQTFINAGFSVDNDSYEYFLKVEGPYYEKETSSVTSDATENEFTITGTIVVTILNKNNEVLVSRKNISISKDHKFSSSNINSSASEENIIKDDIGKYLEIQVINFLRSKI